MTATLPDGVELAIQRARAELHLAPARIARRQWLLDLAAAHHMPAPRLEIDDELAVHAFALVLQARGVEVDQGVLDLPTADQYLAGRRPIPPPPVRRP